MILEDSKLPINNGVLADEILDQITCRGRDTIQGSAALELKRITRT